MADLQPNDELLVNRDNVTYTQEQGTIMANLQGDDYLLINRDDATYKITGQDFIDSVVDPLELTVTLDNTTPAPGDTINTTASPSGGKQPYTPISYQWKQKASDGTVTDISGATTASLAITAGMAGDQIACEATVGDSLGSSVTTLSAYTAAVSYQETVDTPELITPPDGAGMGADISPESGTITDVTVEGPNATMYGLRFDRDRQTYLTRLKSSVTTFTASVWVKGTQDNFRILEATDGDAYTLLQYRAATGDFEITEMPGAVSLISPGGFAANQWHHVVFTYDGTTAKIYANGSEVLSQAVALTGMQNNPEFNIGLFEKGAAYANGYLSDIYFVDGQALEPTEFGYALKDGTWVPLDSSIVTTNIGTSVQSPTSPNYTEKWSDTASWSTDGSDANLFDGNLSNGALCGDASSAVAFRTLTTGSFDVTSQIQIYSNISTGLSLTLRVNDSDEFVSDISDAGANEYRTFDVSSAAGTITKLEVKYPGVTTGYRIYGVSVDGSLLIDGPANTSQVWSDGTQTGSLLNSNWKSAFNGKGIAAGGDNQVLAADSSTAELYFPSVLTGANSVVVHGISQTASAKVNVIAGNDDFIEVTGLPSGSYGPGTAVNVSGRGGLKGIQITSSGTNRGGLTAVVVDGLVLIDGAPTWNTSEVWSDNVTGDFNATYGVEYAFNGNIDDNAYTESGNIVFDATSYNLSVSKLRVRFNAGATDTITVVTSDGNFPFTKNTASDGPDNGKFFWLDCSGVTGTLETITIAKSTGNTSLAAIELNGELLVNSGSFGTNGFYLPFKADEPSIEVINDDSWAEVTTISASPVINNGAIIGYSSTPIVWSCSADVGGSGVQWYQSDDGINWIYQGTANDGAFNSTFESVPVKWICAGGSGFNARTIAGKNGETFKWTQWDTDDRFDQKANTSTPGVLAAVYNSIGLDASGEGNHFLDENFAAGNADEVWSSDTYGSFETARPASEGFNGDTSFTRTEIDLMAGLSFPTINGITSLQIEGARDTNNGDIEVETTSGNFVNVSSNFASGTANLALITIPGITELSGIRLNNNLANAQPRFSKIIVNGEVLIDANIQDTVYDTPMRNYSVLSSGSNGNLVYPIDTDSTATVSAASDTSYYYEIKPSSAPAQAAHTNLVRLTTDSVAGIRADGSLFGCTQASGSSLGAITGADLYAVAFTEGSTAFSLYKNGTLLGEYTATNPITGVGTYSRAGETMLLAHNFGQQPFAASNVIHDINAGTLTFNDDTPNYSQKWSDSISAADLVRPGDVFDGKLTTSGYGFTPITFSANLGQISTLEILLRPYGSSTGGDTTIEGNGITTTVIPAADTMTIQSIPLSGGDVSNIVVTVDPLSGFSNDISAIWVDGNLLIDGPADNSQVWSSGLSANGGAGYTLSSAFDGDLTTRAEADNGATLEFTGTIEGVTKFEVLFRPTNAAPEDAQYTITGTNITQITPGINDNQSFQEVTLSGTTITDFSISAGGSSTPSLTAVRINDKVLIDSISRGTYNTLFETLGSTDATLTITDAGTLNLIQGTPTMTAKVGGATGTYVSHTDTELKLANTTGTWSAASETAISDAKMSIAAIDPNNFVMTSSAFSATPAEATHGSSTWQVTEVADTTYSSPVIDVTSTSALTTYNASGLQGETTYRARVKHTSANNVDSLWSEEVHQNLFKTEAALLDKPDATMYTLRFTQPNYQMLRTQNLSLGSTFTMSYWAKLYRGAQLSGSSEIGDSGSHWNASYGPNAEMRIYTSQGTVELSSSENVVNVGEWNHFVYAIDGTNVKMYCNGAFVGDVTHDQAIAPATNIFRIGGQGWKEAGNAESSDAGYPADGYYSEVYVVDGFALDANVFGSYFPQDPSSSNRRWGPLDSSVIKDNINNYEPTPVGGETYGDFSYTLTGTATQPPSNLFDGNKDTGTWADNSGYTITFDTPIPVTRSVTVQGGSVSDNWSVVISGVEYKINAAGGASPAWQADPLSGGGYEQQVTINATGNLEAIKSSNQNGELRLVYVDTRLLRDGDANQSRAWSEEVAVTTNTTLSQPIANVFDGDTVNGCSSTTTGTGAFIEIDFGSNPLTNVTDFGIWGASVNHLALYFNDSGSAAQTTQPGGDTGRLNAVSPPGTINKVKVQVASSTITANLSAIYVNDVILIDGAPTWNTSQVWSDGFNESEKQFVEGDLNLFAAGKTDGSDYWSVVAPNSMTWTSPVPLTGKVEILAIRGSSDDQVLYVNGDTGNNLKDLVPIGDSMGATGAAWVDLGVSTLNSIYIERPTGPVGYLGIWSIRVGGEILVNKGTFGANGFYLPFKADEPNINWSSKTTRPATSNGVLDNVFNSGTTVGSLGLTDVPQNNKLVIRNNFGNLTSAGAWFGGRGSAQVRIVGDTTVTSSVQAGVNGASNLLTFNSAVSNVTSIEIESTASETIAIYGVEVNGELLINSSSIALDASGQGNNFSDSNFAAGNTDEVWSKGLTASDGFLSGAPAKNAFNGNFSDRSGNAITDTGSISWTGSVAVTSKVEFLTGGSNVIQINNNTQEKTALTTPDPNWVSFDFTGTLTQFTVVCGNPAVQGGSTRSSLHAIKVDGKVLVDKNIQDTVIDTPMRNAAVLETGISGNLIHTGANYTLNSTLGLTSGKAYWEFTQNSGIPNGFGVANSGKSVSFTIVNQTVNTGGPNIIYQPGNEVIVAGGAIAEGDIIGVALDQDTNKLSFYQNGALLTTKDIGAQGELFPFISEYNGLGATTVTANFGQQPLAASNVTHDIDAGTVVLSSTAPNYSQNWSATVFADAGSVGNQGQGFDGDLSTYTFTTNNDGTLTFTPTTPITGVTKVEVYRADTGNPDNTARLNSAGDFVSFPQVTWTTIYEGSGTTLTSLQVAGNPAANALLSAVRVNGQILVDGPADNSRVWSSNVGAGPFEASRVPTNAFDGTPGSGNGVGYAAPQTAGFPPSTEWCTVTFNPPLESVTNLTVFSYDSSANRNTYEIDTSAGTFSANNVESNGAPGRTPVYAGAAVTVNSLRFKAIDEGGNLAINSYSSILYGVEVNGELLVDAADNGPYNTLYQTWDQWATFGTFFYNEQTDEVIQAFTLKRRYGLLGAKPEAGIYELSIQPSFAVAAYIKEDDTYVPIEDPAPRIAAAEQQAAVEVAAAQAETRKYQRMLIRAACGWVVAKSYVAGDIIIYNGHVFRALEDNVATADNDPGDMDGTWKFIGLEEDAAPLALDGYFPLYETEDAANAAGNGSSHTHTIDGVTYYMPDAGVTIYHGNYTGFDY